MLRQIRLDKFPKKATTFRPQILNNITLHHRRPFDPTTPKLIGTSYLTFTVRDTTTNIIYQLYIVRKLNSVIKQNIQFIQQTPNILLLEHSPYSLIFQQQCEQTLKQYLSRREAETGLPYLSETEVREVLFEVLQSMESFEKNNVEYQCLTDHNIARLQGKWMLSLAAAVGNSFALDKNFFDTKRKGKQAIIYALGILTFKLAFGFVPFDDKSQKPTQFKLSTYIDYLQSQPTKKSLKIYYFADRIQLISQRCKLFIEQCLSGKITTFQQLKHHPYLTFSLESQKKEFYQNKEIKMLNYFEKKYHSLIMAAIDRRKKNPYEKLHPKLDNDIAGFLQLKEDFSKDSLLCMLKFDEVQTQSEIKREEKHHNNLKIQCKYFENQFDFQQNQRPTLQLIKFIQKDKTKNPDLYQKKQDRQAKIKLYAFPYTMVFQLAKCYSQQPIQIKTKIQQLIPYLLEVSSLHWPIDRLTCLHHTKLHHSRFDQIKLKYRQLINFIYKHFLTEAMKRYNAKKQNLTMIEKIRLKQEGLEYYRLCLKLMEVSLIVRKGGKDLDLSRIETSQRKEIQQDLEIILKTYFPNRVQIK